MVETNVRLIIDKLGDDDAFASVTLNPTLRWLKFILTDDQPNENKQRIPQDEFDNLIRSGVNMPIKMGLAALWSKERPEDLDIIINEFEAGTPPQISWEVPYTEEVENENGIKDLKGIILRAATLVRSPAYSGRTPILAVAAKTNKPTETNSIKETNNMTDDKLKELEVQLSDAKEKITELEGQLKEKTDSFASVEEELTELRGFKAQIDKDADEDDKLASVRTKFTDAEIEKSDEYFAENRERFLSLDEEGLDFLVQEMSAFAKTSVASAAKKGDDGDDLEEGIPAVINTDGEVSTDDAKALGRMLREQRQKE